ncbi:M20/M25/M40 family metallo-hydrolase [Formosa sp. L2A11]|uniref:M20/M25/M40 family metallo-hydrolase n=1 Tax=Formosa sp. L2A11 TaxID=2686363 RepID=UPI00131CF30E|nr:M20/M25/M40 family metallo-hydrolase [Formosa sp. L2A11]
MMTKFLKAVLICLVLCCFTAYSQDNLVANKSATKIINKLVKNKSVKLALQTIDNTDKQTIADMILLTEIPAPPFKEANRAKKFAEMFTEIGVDSVWTDKEGNVLALRKGQKRDKTIVLDAHMDTVFPIETDVTVKVEGNTYTAPGIGDNTRGMALILAVLRAMNTAQIKTDADIVFVGTVGEEGLGDLRGVKYLFSDESDLKIDAWISVDGGSPGRIINGGLGSKRYKAVFSGKGGHSWGSFGLANPHHALGKAITIFTENASEYISHEGEKTSFNIGRIGGGTSVNSIPFESWMEVDMRSLSQKRLSEMDSIFKTSMKQAETLYNATNIEDKVTLKLISIGDRPSGKLSENEPLIQLAIAANVAMGISPFLTTSSTNGNIPIAKNIPAITLSKGGKGRRAHSLDENWTNFEGTKNIKTAFLITLSQAGFVK